MRYLILITALFLAGCEIIEDPMPNIAPYKLGECYADQKYFRCEKYKERWENCEKSYLFYKIIEVGKRKSRATEASFVNHKLKFKEVELYQYSETVKTKCPRELQ